MGPPGSPNGVVLGGDLEGTFPDPTLRAGSVNGSTIADETVTGADIAESTLGVVPLAASATQLSGIPTDDLVRGGGRIWRGDSSDFSWTAAEDGVIRGWAVADLTDEPDPLFIGAQCYPNSDPSGGGVRAALSNYGPTPVEVVVDDGANPPQAVRVAGANATFTPIVANTTRRIVFQGVRGTDQFFFASVFIEHQGDACRATATGYLVP